MTSKSKEMSGIVNELDKSLFRTLPWTKWLEFVMIMNKEK